LIAAAAAAATAWDEDSKDPAEAREDDADAGWAEVREEPAAGPAAVLLLLPADAAAD
jgi:hypothetical protein